MRRVVVVVGQAIDQRYSPYVLNRYSRIPEAQSYEYK